MPSHHGTFCFDSRELVPDSACDVRGSGFAVALRGRDVWSSAGAHAPLQRARLTAANDLAAAADAVLPELVAFRRALRRVTRRPIGLSGSGPTHWALYPSSAEAEEAAAAVREAIGDRRFPSPGEAAPFVTATTIRPPTGGEAGGAAGDGGRHG